MTLLEYRRRMARETQRQTATAVGVSQNTVSAAERGARVDPAILRALAKHFDIPGCLADTLLVDMPHHIGQAPPPPDLNATIREARRQ